MELACGGAVADKLQDGAWMRQALRRIELDAQDMSLLVCGDTHPGNCYFERDIRPAFSIRRYRSQAGAWISRLIFWPRSILPTAVLDYGSAALADTKLFKFLRLRYR